MDKPKRITLDDIVSRDRDVFQVPWPGTEKLVGLMLLRCGEVQDAHFDAVEWFKRKVQQNDGVSAFEFLREKERQEVYRMILQPDTKRPEDRLFSTANDLRKRMSLDEVAYFQNLHEAKNAEVTKAFAVKPEPEDK